MGRWLIMSYMRDSAGVRLDSVDVTSFYITGELPTVVEDRIADQIESGIQIETDRAESIEALLDSRLDTTEAELVAEAVMARNAANLTSGTISDSRIPAGIARDSEVATAITNQHSADQIEFANTIATDSALAGKQ